MCLVALAVDEIQFDGSSAPSLWRAPLSLPLLFGVSSTAVRRTPKAGAGPVSCWEREVVCVGGMDRMPYGY